MDDLSKKKPGSRRYVERSRDKRKIALYPRLPDGSLQSNDDEVGINFICLGCDAVLGRYRMTTMPDRPRIVEMLPMPDGILPQEAGLPPGQAKVLLFCDRCGRDTQWNRSRITRELEALWSPRLRRVVDREV